MFRGAIPAIVAAALTFFCAAHAVGASDPCQSVRSADFRARVLMHINQMRERGAECGSKGRFDAAAPLSWDEDLTGIAQTQAVAMARMGHLTHQGAQGEGLAARAQAAGYSFRRMAENIANGWRRTDQLINDWFESESHCANLMDPRLRSVGLACVADARSWPWWSLTLALRPRDI